MREAPTSGKSAQPRINAERMRQRLAHAATELFLANGFTATSIERITERAGCGRNTFFTHFSRKAVIGHDVADTLHHRALQRINRFHPTDTDQLITTLAMWTTILATRPGWARLELDLADLGIDSHAQTSRRLTHLRAAVTELLTTTMKSATSSVDVETTVTLLASVAVGMADQRAHGLTVPSAIRPHIERILHAVLA
ncbi:TetR/AcrR family transcriptional regulator [Nocardia sp. NPDC050412]|uniref:TetR/AcrR family transcriptional regulator n=1 Tax=Nocardia sp. NPDC050412 TaxID=3364320 RepID=UPI00378F06C5